MGTKTSATTIVTTVLITLIIGIVILSMKHDHTANIIMCVILMVGLFAFTGALIRSSTNQETKKGLRNS